MKTKATQLLINHYIANGEVPWSSGYAVFRQHVIEKVFSDAEAMAKFHSGQPLPAGYGVGLDERCVEYPWVFAQLTNEMGSVLDAGAALNHRFYLDHPIWASTRLHIITLTPEQSCFWDRGISYLFEDLRNLPIKDCWYELVICLSTLEHVGLDNEMFTGRTNDREDAPQDFIAVIHELHRVLKPGGRLLVTVPFGRYRNMGTQQIFDETMINATFSAFEASHANMTFYRYTQKGWQISDLASCQDSEYVDWVMVPPEIRPKKFPIQTDRAVAARAVACLELTKGIH